MTMINNLISFMRKSDYYGALKKLLCDIEYYYNNKETISLGNRILSITECVLICILLTMSFFCISYLGTICKSPFKHRHYLCYRNINHHI